MQWTEEKAKRLGAALLRLREQGGISQETLAYSAGMTKNQYQLIEGGRASGRKDSVAPSNPSLSTLAGLAWALGMSVSKLLKEAKL